LIEMPFGTLGQETTPAASLATPRENY